MAVIRKSRFDGKTGRLFVCFNSKTKKPVFKYDSEANFWDGERAKEYTNTKEAQKDLNKIVKKLGYGSAYITN